MILIIGGAYQGKTLYAREKYPSVSWTDGKTCEREDIFTCEGITEFHEYIRRMLQYVKDPETFALELLRRNPGIIIVSDEIGSGIVPADVRIRQYREMTGRVCTQLALAADEVFRIVCGIAVRIKG